MSATQEAPLIDIHNLHRTYPETQESIFADISLTINKQDFCFIVGKSGVGKTTLIKCLIRQLTPPHKMIFHNKEDISRFGASEVQAYRRKIGVVYQDFKLIDRKNVEENIRYPLEIAGVDTATQEQKIIEVLEMIWLQDKKNVKIPLLSWWEKQRVAIGRALINNPEFIIADEPTGNLDTETSHKIVDTLIDLNTKGHTIVFITHNLHLIEYVNSRVTTKMIEL